MQTPTGAATCSSGSTPTLASAMDCIGCRPTRSKRSSWAGRRCRSGLQSHLSMRIPSIVALALMLTAFAAAQDHSPVPPSAAPAAWPTAQFAATAAKDPGVKKAKQILDDMIQALGGDAYLTLREMKVAGRMYAFYHGRPNGDRKSTRLNS